MSQMTCSGPQVHDDDHKFFLKMISTQAAKIDNKKQYNVINVHHILADVIQNICATLVKR